MTDFASLGIRIDSSQAKSGAAALDDLADAGDRAEKSVEGLAATTGKSNKELAAAQRAAAAAAKSVDDYVKRLQTTAATNGLNARQTTLYELALRGANDAQLKAADSAIRLNEGYEKGLAIGERVKSGLRTIAALSIAAAAAGVVAISKLADQAGKYKDLGEQIGDTASAVSSLQLAADTSGKSIDDAANFSIKLTKALSQTDDESKKVGRGLEAIGINFDEFKQKSPVAQLEAIAKALQGFKTGPGQTAALEAIVKGGAQLLPFFNDLADAQERQVRLTEAQIARADAFSKAQARSASNMKALAETIVVEALPAISDLTDTIKEAVEGTLGLGKGADDLKGNHSIAQFAEDAALFLAQLVDLARKVAVGFQYVGESIGVTAAIAAAASRGSAEGTKSAFSFDPAGAVQAAKTQVAEVSRLIADAREQGKKYSAESISLADTVAAKFAARRAGVSNGRNDFAANDPRRLDAKREIDTSGLSTDKDKKAKGGTTEKDLLGFDIALIKRDLDALTSAYKDAQSILEATHAAGLIDDRDYYESKRGLIRLEEQEQVRALQRENASFRESIDSRRGTDKDRLESQRKIADNENKIGDLRARATTQLTILGIQEESSLKKIAQAYRDAEDAAQAYLDSLRLTQQRELQGFGAGNQERGRTAGRAQIEDRFNQQRQDLAKSRRDSEQNGTFGTDAQKKYDDELDRLKRFQAAALQDFDSYYAERLIKEQSFQVGASEALQNYLDDASKVAKQVEDMFSKALGGLEDAFVSLATTGKADFKSLANSIIADIIRIQIKAALTNSGSAGGGLIGSLLSLFGGGKGFSTNGTGTSLPTAGGAATGTNFVERDMLTIIHQGEAVIPKAFNPAANLSAARGSSGGALQVVMNNQGVQATAREETSTGSDGQQLRRLVIDTVASDMASGTGKTAAAAKSRLGTGVGVLPRRN